MGARRSSRCTSRGVRSIQKPSEALGSNLEPSRTFLVGARAEASVRIERRVPVCMPCAPDARAQLWKAAVKGSVEGSVEGAVGGGCERVCGRVCGRGCGWGCGRGCGGGCGWGLWSCGSDAERGRWPHTSPPPPPPDPPPPPPPAIRMPRPTPRPKTPRPKTPRPTPHLGAAARRG